MKIQYPPLEMMTQDFLKAVNVRNELLSGKVGVRDSF
jgi:hypothetical protein